MRKGMYPGVGSVTFMQGLVGGRDPRTLVVLLAKVRDDYH